MLIHEWMRYRDKHLPRPEGDGEGPAPATEKPAPGPDDDIGSYSLLDLGVRPPPGVLDDEEPAEEQAPEPEETVEAETAPPAAAPARRAPTEVLLDLPEQQSRRLQTLLGRQARLPLEVEEVATPARRGHPEPAESREELIERLLDPIWSINEAAVLCGVCPASIRRYTNRGVLKCFRTPGNQRRFRLSDVLDFMERQQQEVLD
jgi:excisionase family DNA binding protein